MINAHVRDTIDRFPLGFVATVTPGGRPAVSPKGTFLVLDDTTIAFGEIRSPGTLTNLTANPECEVNFVNILTRKGARLRGRARMLRQGTVDFAGLIGKWREVWGDLADRISTLVLIDVEEVRPLTTPPYDDGATEEEMIAAYKAKLGGMYT
jgi:hypothetical protein